MQKTVKIEATNIDGFRVEAETRGHKMIIDQPVEGKGQDSGPTPLEQFLFSLAGCICTIGRIAAMQKKIALRSINVTAEGDYDPAGLLGRESENRNGFQQIRVVAAIDADLSDEEKKAFLDEVCERCPLHDNIKLATEVVHELS